MAGQGVIPHLRHNIVGLLYTIKGMAGSHLAQVEEGRFENLHARLDHAEESLKKAYSRADHALEVTQRLGRALASREKSEGPVRPEGTDVKQSWFHIERVLRREFSLKGIDILLCLAEDFPPVACDPVDFEEILYQLARNSFYAMAGAGRLTIRGEQGFASCGGPVIWVTLSDTGAGIPREQMGRMFTPFFTTKAPGEGNGLGLYLTNKLVKKNHGRMTVTSSEGSGTTFVIEFPL